MTAVSTEQPQHPGADALNELINEILQPGMNGRPFETNVYTFGEGKGVRVSEVSYWVPDPDNPRLGGGASWMRSDPEAAPVILSCEEFLLCFDEPVQVFDGWVNGKYDPAIVDVAQETRIRVRQALLDSDENPTPWEHHWPKGLRVLDMEWHDPEKKAAYDKAQEA